MNDEEKSTVAVRPLVRRPLLQCYTTPPPPLSQTNYPSRVWSWEDSFLSQASVRGEGGGGDMWPDKEAKQTTDTWAQLDSRLMWIHNIPLWLTPADCSYSPKSGYLHIHVYVHCTHEKFQTYSICLVYMYVCACKCSFPYIHVYPSFTQTQIDLTFLSTL